ncbi:MAG: M20/M25/M40 family metallo-hydrolase [Phycisphaeraceae bacterium]
MATKQENHERYLTRLTGIPTAAGREDRVIDWIEAWADRRSTVRLRRDRYGNLMLQREHARAAGPIIFQAHLDHPAFVVTRVAGHMVEAEFRGGVRDAFFVGSEVVIHHGERTLGPGRVAELLNRDDQPAEHASGGRDQQVRVEFDEPSDAAPRDVMTWNLPAPRIDERGRLHAPACDDLAAVAAALAAFEDAGKLPGRPDVRVLLTRAEEVGFVGAIGTCRANFIPPDSRLITLENSKSFPDSPIGGGPILRVGDRTSTFDPELTYRLGKIGEQLESEDESFKWQRKLMAGGTCEATAFQALGVTASSLCLPLGNYHNMNEETGKIDSESIALADYHGLIRFLTRIAARIDEPSKTPPLTKRLDDIFDRRQGLLKG